MYRAESTLWVKPGPQLNEAEFKTKLARLTKATGGSYGLSPSLIDVRSNIASAAGDIRGWRPVSFEVYLPDGVNSELFKIDLQTQACASASSLVNAFAPWTK